MPDPWQICQKYNVRHPSCRNTGKRDVLHKIGNSVSRFLIIIIIAFAFPPLLFSASILPTDTIDNGGYIITRNGKQIDSFRARERFVPASTIKLLTSLTALNYLGADYRFTTSFYIDNFQILYVRGTGDPFITSETIAQIAVELKKRGIKTIRSYVLDDSAFNLEHEHPAGSLNSENPYDAPNGALAVNFNSIAIMKKQDGSAQSGENQTPTTTLAKEIGSKLSTGKHRVNIGAFEIQGNISSSLRYSAELMHNIFTNAGVDSTLEFRRGKVPTSAKEIFKYSSEKSVKELVRLCLHYSNNFLANQLALTAGATLYGYPATWDKARKTLNHFATKRLGIPTGELQIQEGAGLSRQTLATPDAMLKIVEAFAPHRELLPTKFGFKLKSGTLEDVYCYAGYLDTPDGTVMFSLLLNQQTNNRNRLIKTIRKKLAHN